MRNNQRFENLYVRKIALALAAICAYLAISAAGASAAIMYSYVTDQTSYSTTPGGSVTAIVYLEESGAVSSLIALDGGLFGAGFSVTRASTGLPANPSAINTIAGSVTSNGSNFSGGSFTIANGASASFSRGLDAGNVSASSGPTPTSGLIEIGSITVTGGTSAGTTNFTLGNYNYPALTGGYTQTFGTAAGSGKNVGYDLDKTNTGTNPYTGAGGSAGAETFSVTVNTPEPGSIAMAAIGLSVMLTLRPHRPKFAVRS